MFVPFQFPFLYDSEQGVMWSNGSCYSVSDFLVCDTVAVSVVRDLAVRSHLQGFYSSLEVSSEGPGFVSVQDGDHKCTQESDF